MKTTRKQNVMLEDRHLNCLSARQVISINKSAQSTCKMENYLDQHGQHYFVRSKSGKQQATGSSVLISLAIGLLLASVHSNALTNNNNNNNNANSSPTSPGAITSPVTPASQARSQQVNLTGESSSVNLIPVDQPVSSSGLAPNGGRPKPIQSDSTSSLNEPTSPGSGSLATGSLRSASDHSVTTTMDNQASGRAGDSVEVDSSGGPSSAGASQTGTAAAAAAGGSGGEQDEFSEPAIGQYYAANENIAASQQYEQQKEQLIQQQQQQQQQQEVYPSPIKQPDGIQQHQRQQFVERRFGLFKKGHHYGSPMMSGANYASSGAYLTDCERCLANLGQQSSADLQQLEPLGPMPPVVQPPMPSLPLPAPPPPPSAHFGASSSSSLGQPFGPLKSKLFMKFPFFVKPGFGGEQTGGAGHSSFVPQYWPVPTYQQQQQQQHHHHQSHHTPTIRPNALFIRPQAPAYNCIQASPPLVAVASANQEISQYTLASPVGTKSTSSSSSSSGTKNAYPHQQNIYSSSSY